jgi:hypothetical protein
MRGRLAKLVEALAKEDAVADAVRKIQAQEANSRTIRDLESELLRLAEAKFFTIVEYQKDFNDGVLIPFRALCEKRGHLGAPMVIGREEIESRVVSMEAALENGKHDQVVVLYEEVRQLRTRMPSDPALDPLFRRADATKGRASTYLEFAAKELTIGGCVVYANDPRQSVVILNQRSYSPGETVEEGLVITAITPSELTFNFRGVKVSRRHSGDGVH